MTPHNEHIMLKYAQTRQAEQAAEARQSAEQWAVPSRRGRGLALSLALRIGVAATLMSAALLVVVWLIA